MGGVLYSFKVGPLPPCRVLSLEARPAKTIEVRGPTLPKRSSQKERDMRILDSKIACVIALISAVIAGCSGSQALPGTVAIFPTGSGWILPSVKTSSLLYISDYSPSEVYIFPEQGSHQKMIGKITSNLNAPEGLYVASNGDLYVANSGDRPGTIAVFKKGELKPYKMLTLPSSVFAGIASVAMDSHGNVYATEQSTQLICEIGAGHGTCTNTLSDPYDFYLSSIAINSKNDLFVMGNSRTLDELPSGSTKWIKLPPRYSTDGGLTFDSHDNLLLDDAGNGSTATISEYAPPYKKAPVFSFNYYGQMGQIVLDSTGTNVWGPNYPYSDGREYSVPKGKLLNKTGGVLREPVGVAVDPAAKR
jgi:hypothetical protein